MLSSDLQSFKLDIPICFSFGLSSVFKDIRGWEPNSSQSAMVSKMSHASTCIIWWCHDNFTIILSQGESLHRIKAGSLIWMNCPSLLKLENKFINNTQWFQIITLQYIESSTMYVVYSNSDSIRCRLDTAVFSWILWLWFSCYFTLLVNCLPFVINYTAYHSRLVHPNTKSIFVIHTILSEYQTKRYLLVTRTQSNQYRWIYV